MKKYTDEKFTFKIVLTTLKKILELRNLDLRKIFELKNN